MMKNVNVDGMAVCELLDLKKVIDGELKKIRFSALTLELSQVNEILSELAVKFESLECALADYNEFVPKDDEICINGLISVPRKLGISEDKYITFAD